jgi:hypothetical protein
MFEAGVLFSLHFKQLKVQRDGFDVNFDTEVNEWMQLALKEDLHRRNFEDAISKCRLLNRHLTA